MTLMETRPAGAPATTESAATMPPGAWRAVALATLAFAVNFWGWSLLSPLGPTYKSLLGLSPLALSVLVAVPVIVGSLGRIPIGGLTDRYGGRVMLTAISLVSIAPVTFLAFTTSYPALIAGGFVLGIGGASFAAGVPFVNSWVPPAKRGLALGIYGMGNIGTAVSGFLTPRIADNLGREWAFLIVTIALVATAAAVWSFGREAPDRVLPQLPFGQRLAAASKLPLTARMAALYAVTFGGFVAFGVYLPTYLKDVYSLGTADAATRAAGFVVLATLIRPLGGMVADRVDGARLLVGSFAVVTAGAIVVSFAPPMVLATVAFLTMAAALGFGNGAVFALVGQRAPVRQVGTVTGIVGAAGGLGGFVPPLVMGVVYQGTGHYAIGLLLLAVVAFAAGAYTWARLVTRAPASAR